MTTITPYEDTGTEYSLEEGPTPKKKKITTPEYCRICAKMFPIKRLRSFERQSSTSNFLLAMIRQINISVNRNDGLPQNVCKTCIQHLKTTKVFIEKVDAAQAKLTRLLMPDNNTTKKEHVIQVEEPLSSDDDFLAEYNKAFKAYDVNDSNFVEPKYLKESIENSNDYTGQTDELTVKIENKLPDIASLTAMLPTYNNIPTMIEDNPIKMEDMQLPRWSNFWCCKRCDTQFDTLNSLREHSLKQHDRCVTFKCVVCIKRIFTYKHYFQHMSKHDPKLRQCCEYCDGCFESNSDARWHKEREHGDIEKPHQCKICGTYFDTEAKLRVHSECYTVVKAKTAGGKLFKCHHCNKEFANKIGLRGHLDMHDRLKHYCDVCNKSFSTKYVHLLHMENVHNPQPRYMCQTCGKFFKLKTSLNCHMDVHKGLRPYPCDVCNKMFRTLKLLKSHKVSHGDVKKHICKVCSKSYKYHTGLRDHMRTHNNVRPYKCDICPKDFISWSNFNKHMKAIHSLNMAKSSNRPFIENN